MIDTNYRDMDKVQPESYQLVIVSDGRYFRSGCWVRLDDETGYFLTDHNGAYECKYWIPLPTGISNK